MQRDFYVELAHHLIDNVFDSVGLRGWQMIVTESVVYYEGELNSGVDIHLNPSIARRGRAMDSPRLTGFKVLHRSCTAHRRAGAGVYRGMPSLQS
jgi:hypothetical protein